MASKRTFQRRRRGLATIELLLCLPLLATLCILILTIAAAGVAVCGSVTNAYEQACDHRHDATSSRSLLQDNDSDSFSYGSHARYTQSLYSKILNNKIESVWNGLVEITVTKTMEQTYAPLTDHLGAIRRRHAFFVGSWSEAIAVNSTHETYLANLSKRLSPF